MFDVLVRHVAFGGPEMGTVQFKVDGVNSGTPVTLAAGKATKANSTLAHGTHSIQAV